MLIKAVAQATAKSLGFAEKEVQIVSSRSQLQRKRSECREEMAIMIKQEFTPDVPLVVHWDGKLMPSSVGIFRNLFVLSIIYFQYLA